MCVENSFDSPHPAVTVKMAWWNHWVWCAEHTRAANWLAKSKCQSATFRGSKGKAVAKFLVKKKKKKESEEGNKPGNKERKGDRTVKIKNHFKNPINMDFFVEGPSFSIQLYEANDRCEMFFCCAHAWLIQLHLLISQRSFSQQTFWLLRVGKAQEQLVTWLRCIQTSQ